MTEPRHIILHCPATDEARLDSWVEQCLARGVQTICCWGDGCDRIHDILDEIIVADGSGGLRCIETTWHIDDSLDAVREIAGTFRNRDYVEVRL